MMKDEPKAPAATRRKAGRPRSFDPGQALRAVLLLFWKHGFDGTSYTELTAATGMSKPTLYATFGDKIELFRKAMVLYAEQSLEVYQRALAQPTAREAVEACLRLARGLHAQADEPEVCFLVQGALTGSADTQELREEVSALQRQATQLLQKRLERGKRNGELPSTANTRVMAEYFTSVVTGLSVQAATGTSRRDLREVVEMAMASWPSRPKP